MMGGKKKGDHSEQDLFSSPTPIKRSFHNDINSSTPPEERFSMVGGLAGNYL